MSLNAVSHDRHRQHDLRVLVADADEDTRSLYRELLERDGCEVMEATDGRQALAQAVAQPRPAFILTETRLPFLDGFSLCQLLRNDPDTCDIRILVVTADGFPDQIERARRAGADAVLVKPVSVETVIAESRRLIEHSHHLRWASEAIYDQAAERVKSSASLLERVARKTFVKAHHRYETSKPPLAPPDLRCPSCDRLLKYERSYLGGVSEKNSEQWDYYSCEHCGTYQYRHRTRKLRTVS
jgi:CheY-like chemotaxis protein